MASQAKHHAKGVVGFSVYLLDAIAPPAQPSQLVG
jgi:hypothetical protein